MTIYLSIDPGLKHTCVSIVRVGQGEHHPEASVLWSEVYNFSGQVNPDKDKAHESTTEIQTVINQLGEPVEKILIEFQPPINVNRNPALARWNSWIEGYFVSEFKSWPMEYVHPYGLKRHFDIVGGSHSVNKSLVLTKSKEFLDIPVKTDHEADCVLMCVYQYQKENGGVGAKAKKAREKEEEEKKKKNK